ncbi:MAG: M48 family metallopeptidase [Candidatus Thorarchaeota archaeon]
MNINKTLLRTRTKLHLSNILFVALNIFHIIVVSTSNFETVSEGILQFRFHFFYLFKWQSLIIGLVIAAIQILVTYIIIYRKFRRASLVEVTELGLNGGNDEKILKNLRMNPQKIHKWVMDLAEQRNIKSIKRVYLTDTSIPNAFTLDVLPLPLIRITWIVLDADVLEILDEREIKAVIAHELGHVKRLDGIINIFRFGINYFVFLTYAIFIVRMFYNIIVEQPFIAINIALKSAFLVVILVILWLFTIISRVLLNFSRRQSELMADYYASQTVGRNHIINALVLLGQRMDVIAAFGTEFRWLGSLEGKDNLTREFIQGLKSLPPEELSKKISREKAVQIYICQRLKNLKEDLLIPFTDKQIDEFTENASKSLIKIREESVENGFALDRQRQKEIVKLTIDWLLVDKDKDLYLNDEELLQLVKIIKENPNKELFEEDLEKHHSLLGSDHPTMRERILFLFDSTS